jgi:hypothetical protein
VRASVVPSLDALGIALSAPALKAAASVTHHVPPLVEDEAFRPAMGVATGTLRAGRERVGLSDPVVPSYVPVALLDIGKIEADDGKGGVHRLSPPSSVYGKWTGPLWSALSHDHCASSRSIGRNCRRSAFDGGPSLWT